MISILDELYDLTVPSLAEQLAFLKTFPEHTLDPEPIKWNYTSQYDLMMQQRQLEAAMEIHRREHEMALRIFQHGNDIGR